MIQPSRRYDLPTIIFAVLFIAAMCITSFWVIQPFILGFAWAGMVVIASWPLLIKIERLLWGRRSLAVFVMILLLIVVFIFPITLLINSMVDNSAAVVSWFNTPGKVAIPELAWLKAIPMIGDSIYSNYHQLISTNTSTLLAKVQPYIGKTVSWMFSQAAQLGRFLVHCILMLLFSVLLYARGEQVSLAIRHFAVRLANSRGDAAVLLAGQAIRAVALGVVVTALVQSVLGGIGLAVVGIPAATLLTVLMFICCLAQLGPLLILIPAILWLYWSGDTTWGTVLLVWSCLVGTLDNFLRPVLIRMGADLPLFLVLSGVIGGLLAFGMIGLFIGPVVLAVSYRLISAWIDEVPKPNDHQNGD
ncbi:AI-2E family transporter YdiK [Serratia microhaemolytica]|uniref:AI-2E family transporter YdiK n=1 Tax=Serratia microhaemolytica TaxID=2675110 RepID=UPI000FDD0DAE|nr:AI-2E family transporter YdiK [Serratia microhaemolytica]